MLGTMEIRDYTPEQLQQILISLVGNKNERAYPVQVDYSKSRLQRLVTKNDRTLSGLPRMKLALPDISFRAVLIGPFEGSRWCVRRMRSGYGN
jgi:hypothetical protein